MSKEDYFSTNILAKPNETLSVHINNAILVLKQILNWKASNIMQVCKLLNVDNNELVARLFAMVYLHDIGKSCYSFQKHIRSMDKKSRAFPHALLSLPFVISSVPSIKINGNEEYFETLAVMSHHTSFYDNLYSQYIEADPETEYKPDFNKLKCKEYAFNFYKYLPECYKQYFNKPYPFDLSEPDLSQKFGILLSKLKQTIRRDDRLNQLHFIYSLFVSVMHYCDWIASGKPYYKYSEEMIIPPLELYIKQNSSFKSWNEIQKKARVITGNLMLSAPTGKGKTESALLWASTNLNSGKIVYLLPTRVTVNAMYYRLQNIFGDSTGLSHGTSLLRIAEDEKWNNSNIITKRLLFGTFMSPTTVATVDQLLLSQFNLRNWEMIEQNASNSVIIFDEIHAYDFYTLALITEIIKTLAKRGSRFAFLSATLPSFLKEHFSNLLNLQILIDEEFKGLKRHHIKFLNQDIIDSIDDVIKAFEKGKKILVIVNTVDTSIEFYQTIKDQFESKKMNTADLLLYHSRFIEKHRRDKEDKIKDGEDKKDGFIAITTQVIEVSLDIDYDILFTQVAPLDALIQRFGRVNRKGIKSTTIENVLIYNYRKVDELIYGEENLKKSKDIIEASLTGKIPSEDDISKLIDIQYPKEKNLADFREEWGKNVKKDLLMLRRELWDIQTLLLGKREDILYKIARSRKEKIPDIEVIPYMYKEKVESLEHKLESIYYLLKIPLYKFKKCIIPRTEDSIWSFADIEYSYDEGAISCK
jgi:CRISPR-associated endonuclease/helicase Cas3